MLSTLLLDPHWEGLGGVVYACFFIVGTTLIGLIIGIVVELRRNAEGSGLRVFIGLAILVFIVVGLVAFFA